MKNLFLLSIFLIAPSSFVCAWDSADPNFPTTDTPYLQLKTTATDPPDPSVLGYFPVAATRASGGTNITTGAPNVGKFGVTRAVLALMADARSTEPVLFPDWSPGGSWAPAGSVWTTAGGDAPYMQRLYNSFSHFAPATDLLTDADRAANQYGAITVSNTIPPAAPIGVPNQPCYQQGILTYNIYGNSMQPFIPKTLADDGPLPTKDERAWPLPYDQCP